MYTRKVKPLLFGLFSILVVAGLVGIGSTIPLHLLSWYSIVGIIGLVGLLSMFFIEGIKLS